MSKWESYVSDKGRELVNSLTRIDRNLSKIVSEIATTSETSNSYWTRIQREIRSQYEQARKLASSWTDETIPIVYRNRMRETFTNIKAKVLRPPVNVKVTDFLKSNTGTQRLSALLANTNASFYTGLTSGNKTMIQLARYTQQVNISEREIEKAISSGFLESGTLRGAQKRTQQALLKKAMNGQYITVIDKNGKPTQWKVDTYAELVAHTKMIEASTQASVDAAIRYGGDLIGISVHNTDCEVCAEYEGKIYSLSGQDPDFPPVEDLPPYHCRCKHTCDPYFREGLEAAGILDQYADFSNGRTEEHPTRPSFVPVSTRELT